MEVIFGFEGVFAKLNSQRLFAVDLAALLADHLDVVDEELAVLGRHDHLGEDEQLMQWHGHDRAVAQPEAHHAVRVLRRQTD